MPQTRRNCLQGARATNQMEKISRKSPYNQTLLHTGSKIAAVPRHHSLNGPYQNALASLSNLRLSNALTRCHENVNLTPSTCLRGSSSQVIKIQDMKAPNHHTFKLPEADSTHTTYLLARCHTLYYSYTEVDGRLKISPKAGSHSFLFNSFSVSSFSRA